VTYVPMTESIDKNSRIRTQSTPHRLLILTSPGSADCQLVVGRPRHTWLRTLEADLQPLNHGLNIQHGDTPSRTLEAARGNGHQGHAHDDGEDDELECR